MTRPDDALPRRLERRELVRQARAQGLPDLLAERVADVVDGSHLSDERRAEVFREMVSHFEDGLAAGRSPEDLSQSFGDGRHAATLIRAEKRVVTPESMGGSGGGDGVLRMTLRDVRYAARRLLARPAFTAIAVISLAIGIGANAAIFTLVNEVILRRPPLERPEELVDIYGSNPDAAFNPLAYPEYQDLARMTELFSGVAATRMGYAVRSEGDRTERLAVQLVSGNYFQVLGLRPARGRLIEPNDGDAAGRSPVAVLSDRYWRRAYGGDPSVVGRSIRLSGGEYTIIGVTRPDFQSGFPSIGIEIFVPVTMVAQLMASTENTLESRGDPPPSCGPVSPAASPPAGARVTFGAFSTRLHEQRVTGGRASRAFRPPHARRDPLSHRPPSAPGRRRHDGRGGDGPPDRLRQPGRLPPRPGRRSPQGGGHPARHRRQSATPRLPAPHRNAPAGDDGRRCRSRARPRHPQACWPPISPSRSR
ncbi:MAG: ABC transporter permease [Gemmatimonadetes bacterium]|nr:ABC transporter permease [Gemmatimonadota bacterium]